MPVEPPPTRWRLPDPDDADESGIVGIGADLAPGTLLHAYRHGLFPMPLHTDGPIAWWSPDPRGVIPLDGLRVSRSLRASCRRYEIRVDSDFGAVIDGCASPRRDGRWIDQRITHAYRHLHELGWAHSVETWDQDGLAGGLYGVCIGGFFAGESMFHRRRDASKVALVGLVEILAEDGLPRLLDVQWTTEHLRSLGAVDVPRNDYIGRLSVALNLPMPSAFT